MPQPVNYFSLSPYRVAVIGAASGIGKAAAMFMARQGVEIHCIDRDKAGAETAAKDITNAGGSGRSRTA